MNQSLRTAAKLSLGLVLRFLAAPHRVGDVRVFAGGRLHLWPRWSELDESDERMITRFLGARPEALSEDAALLRIIRWLLQDGSDFEREDTAEDSVGWSAQFRLVPGKPLVERLGGWLAEIESVPRRGSRVSADLKDLSGGVLNLTARPHSYSIPQSHVPADDPVIRVTACPRTDRFDIDRHALRLLARKLDSSRRHDVSHEKVAIDGLLDMIRTPAGSHLEGVDAGPTQLLVAPTGAGKSVLVRLLALHLAQRGIPAAIVVPDVLSVWSECKTLEELAVAAEMTAVSVSPLSSWRSTAERLVDYAETGNGADADLLWVLRRVGYGCLLSAYSSGAEPPVGEEPCTRLRQPGVRSRSVGVSCPFGARCGRLASFYAAARADIVVVNHHALLQGRVPLPVSVDGTPARPMSVSDLVLYRCGVVLIDEIDALQNAAVNASSKALRLSSTGGVSLPHQLLAEMTRHRAEGTLGQEVNVHAVRSALHRLTYAGEQLADLVNSDQLDWPGHGRLTWRDANDGWLVSRLYPDLDDGFGALRAIFSGDRIEGDERSERMRGALWNIAGPGLGDGTRIDEIRAELDTALRDGPSRSRTSEAGDQDARSRLIDRLLLRAFIMQLDSAQTDLRPELPMLEQNGIDEANRIREEMLGYAPWSPSPTGALGHRLHGYAFSSKVADTGALETRLLNGDPHGLIAELGGLVSRSRIGSSRIVLGLSATARFRGSPSCDVLAPVCGAVDDLASNVEVRPAPVDVRISGVSIRSERLRAARQMGPELWGRFLRGYLESLSGKQGSAQRAKALLVTSSYPEAREVYEGLTDVMDPERSTLRVVVNPDLYRGEPHELHRRDLKRFGSLPSPAVLVAPLKVVARGHNILQPGTERSAITGIFVLTRPVPPSDDAGRLLAHLSYNARLAPPPWKGGASETVMEERRQAHKRLRAMLISPGAFGRLDPELRREIVCDVLVDLAQLAGRARRGGTPVHLHFVDAAFEHEFAPWKEILSDVITWWRERGWLSEMSRLHGAFLNALKQYAGIADRPDDE